jgi:hypothetical protein
LDTAHTEFAKTAATSPKYYYDKVKAILAAKCRTNEIVQSFPTITQEAIKTIKIPVFQIMGLSWHIYNRTCYLETRIWIEKLFPFSKAEPKIPM